MERVMRDWDISDMRTDCLVTMQPFNFLIDLMLTPFSLFFLLDRHTAPLRENGTKSRYTCASIHFNLIQTFLSLFFVYQTAVSIFLYVICKNIPNICSGVFSTGNRASGGIKEQT